MANAVRLTKEENNQAYREADQMRIMQNNDIVGYQIQLNNVHKIVDICDDLKDFYPKTFVWKGWHIGCMCQRFTVRKTDKEIIDEISHRCQSTAGEFPELYCCCSGTIQKLYGSKQGENGRLENSAIFYG
ncbi:hypothetical protein [Chryseobacterium sp.]|uniref:hypothetical protein n=1 Tax=Chryseobacterium sp. TaxID=1871047 RepID=UPI00289F5CC5|nr:hypothetical protein [Chryseobacterium sp.]